MYPYLRDLLYIVNFLIRIFFHYSYVAFCEKISNQNRVNCLTRSEWNQHLFPCSLQIAARKPAPAAPAKSRVCHLCSCSLMNLSEICMHLGRREVAQQSAHSRHLQKSRICIAHREAQLAYNNQSQGVARGKWGGIPPKQKKLLQKTGVISECSIFTNKFSIKIKKQKKKINFLQHFHQIFSKFSQNFQTICVFRANARKINAWFVKYSEQGAKNGFQQFLRIFYKTFGNFLKISNKLCFLSKCAKISASFVNFL